MSQSDVWAGTSTYVDTEVDTETDSGSSDVVTASGLKGWLDSMVSAIGGWFSDVLSAIRAIPDSFSDWFTEVIEGIKATPGSFADWFEGLIAGIEAIPSSIADVFKPSGDLDTYTLELKDFFPFCIPYDLYDLFNAFTAEPETPYWEFEFDFGDLGTFPGTIDLSMFDEFAAIARKMQVICFCICLALGTKKILGW